MAGDIKSINLDLTAVIPAKIPPIAKYGMTVSSTQNNKMDLKWDPLNETFSDISFNYLVESNAPLNMRYSVMVSYLNIYCSSRLGTITYNGLPDDGGLKSFKSVVVKDNTTEKVISSTGSIGAILTMQYKSYSNYYGMDASMADGSVFIKFPSLKESLDAKYGDCKGGGGIVFNIHDLI